MQTGKTPDGELFSLRLCLLARSRYLMFIIGAWVPMAGAQDLRTDVTAGNYSPTYYSSVMARVKWKATGHGLLPSHTYSVHSGDSGNPVFVTFHTDGTGAITDGGGTQTTLVGTSGNSSDIGDACTAAGTPTCTGVPVSGWTSTNHLAVFADDGSIHVAATGGIGAVTASRLYYPGGGPLPQPAQVTNDVDALIQIGTDPCAGLSTTVTVGMSNSSGFNVATNVHVNVFIGTSGSGWFGQFFLDNNTLSQSISISAALSGVIDGGPVSVTIADGSYAYDSHDAPVTFTITAPSTFHCGTNVTVSLAGHAATAPTPTPVPSPTVTTSATPPPLPTATVTPAPFGSPPPAGAPTPPPNVSVSNGTAKSDVIIDNPNDFYNPMRKALEDAGRGMGAPGDGNGGGGAFGSGNGTHDSGDYGSRGHVDDIARALSSAQTARDSTVSGLSGKITGLVTAANALSGQTFGSVTTISMNFNSIGSAPAVGHVVLPTVIDLEPWSGMISTLRLVLLWLIRIAFFVLVFRLFAAQGVKA